MSAMPPRRKWPPILFRAALCLLGGFLLSTFVAWAAASLFPMNSWFNILGQEADAWAGGQYVLPQYRSREKGGDALVDYTAAPMWSMVQIAPIRNHPLDEAVVIQLPQYVYPEAQPAEVLALHGHPAFDLPRWALRPSPTTDARCITTCAWGWPARCLRGVEFVHESPNPAGGQPIAWTTVEGFILDRPPGPGLQRLPIQIIWPGIAIDSAIYAAVVGVLGLTTRGASQAVRGALRRRRGLCPRCAYDLQGLAPGATCPECGDKQVTCAAPAP